MSRESKIEHLKKVINTLEENLAHINEALIMVKNQIKAERAQIPKNPRKLKKRFENARSDLKTIQKEIDKNKLKATRLKNRIDEIKTGYEHQLEPNPENWPKLYDQVKEIGDQVVDCESAVIALELQKHAAEEAKEWAKISWRAYIEGVYKKPAKQDPRMIAIFDEQKKIETRLRIKKAQLKELRPKSKRR
jgi:chromosome segregation ATPase